MLADLPDYLLNEDTARESASSLFRLIATVVALLSGWIVLQLPGSPIQPHRPPYDRPWMEQGLRGVFINSSGEWTIHRAGYVDHNEKYIVDAAGRLEQFEDTGGLYHGEDVSGVLGGGRSNRIMRSGAILNVEPAPLYFRWQQLLKARRITIDTPMERVVEILRSEPPPAQSREAQLREYVTTREALERHGDATMQRGRKVLIDPPEDKLAPHVRLEYSYKTTRDDVGEAVTEVRTLLPGHHYFAVFDAAVFKEPDLWLTTNRGTALHHFHVDDQLGKLSLTKLSSTIVPLNQVDRGVFLVHDPQREMLAVVLPDGRRLWFDPEPLKFREEDKLPGSWSITEAAITTPGQPFYFQLGYALSGPQYRLLMQFAVVVFLGSLLWLAISWRHAWNSTAGPTTADSN